MRNGLIWTMASALALAAAASAQAAPAAKPAGKHRVLARIAGPDGGWDYAAVDAVNGRVLVSRGDGVTAVDLKTGAVTPKLVSGSRVHTSLPVNDGAEIMLTNGATNEVAFVNAKTGAPAATVAVGKNPDAAAVDAKSGLVLVMNHTGGDITLIDPKAHKAVGVIPVGGKLEAAATDGEGRAYVNVEDKGEVAVVDIAKRAVVARYKPAGCEGPTGIVYVPAGGRLITACDGAAVVLSAKTGRVLQTVKTGGGVDSLAYDKARGLVFAPAGDDGSLTIMAIGPKVTVAETVATQKSARTIALDEQSGRVYLPAAEHLPAAGGERPQVKPGSFVVLVVGR
ncbi:YncE family protein [Caulobacter sp. CCUG 60055]|uniref:YncE family protein n=1 Tax=Caulobacter sp. CCUG 60055 TaxID=2100090 RepID=UPI001FA7C4C3|nr:YncE family protein [Caulobacter sp. CCUG 60055]MBQ1540664.1 YncE family protein [Caulobacteraceae bacterium]